MKVTYVLFGLVAVVLIGAGIVTALLLGGDMEHAEGTSAVVSGVGATPTAGSGAPSDGDPVLVLFSATSTVHNAEMSLGAAAVDTYFWDFGDETSSNEPSPEHLYDESGTYQVRLTITRADGSSYTEELTVDTVRGVTAGRRVQ